MAPDFSLPDAHGESYSLSDFDGKGLLVAFICAHCPFVVHIRKELGHFGREYQEKGLSVVAIVSNDLAQYPQDGPDGMLKEAEEGGYTFPYLLDENQEVAKAYRAACTPDFFLFDGERKLAYRGQFDGSRPGNGLPVTGEDLRAAADAVLAGEPVRKSNAPASGATSSGSRGTLPTISGEARGGLSFRGRPELPAVLPGKGKRHRSGFRWRFFICRNPARSLRRREQL